MLNLAKFTRCAFALAAILTISSPARTHVHADTDGTLIDWYPKECCSDGDCRPVIEIVPASQGLWMTTSDGHTVLVGPKDRRLPSRDTRWHICINPMTEPPVDSVTCIFEPSNS